MTFKKLITTAKIFYLIIGINYLHAETNFFDEGKKLFEKQKFDEAKIEFEKDIVFNPKSELSYLYLSKIFKNKEKQVQEENNLNTVILLNPKNEDALYGLILLNIKKSNFENTKELIRVFETNCVKLCNKNKEISKKLKNVSK